MKRKLALLLVCLLTGIGLVIAQTPRKVTGIVTSEEDNEPVVGASVLVKGTTMGTVTDIDGKFTINNVPSSASKFLSTFTSFLAYREFNSEIIVHCLYMLQKSHKAYFSFRKLKSWNNS